MNIVWVWWRIRFYTFFFIPRSFAENDTAPRSFFHLYILYIYIKYIPAHGWRAYRRADYYCSRVHTQMPPETFFHILCACLSPLLFLPIFTANPDNNSWSTPPPLTPGHHTWLLLQSYTTHVVFGCARDRFLIPMHTARAVFTPALPKSADGLL